MKTLLPLAATLLALALAVACAVDPGLPGPPSLGEDASYDAGYSEGFGSTADPDAYASSPTSTSPHGPADAAVDGGKPRQDAGWIFDAPADAPACTMPTAPGDLAIVELMIASQAGTGDHGEWLEVRSTRNCSVNLNGFHAECPRGSGVNVADIAGDTWLPAGHTFLIADSSDPFLDNGLPAPLLTWNGAPADVLHNGGDTVTLSVKGVLIDSVTYPARTNATDGTSLSFPASCDPTSRTDWTFWQASTASWTPGFYGTPNAPNTDVSCP